MRRRLVAACRIASTILGVGLLLGGVDFGLRYTDRGLHLLATAIFLGISGWSIYHWWLALRRSPLSPIAVARRVETQFPQLRDSLTSAVEFLEQSEGDRAAGSPMLRRAVVNNAEMKLAALPIEEVVDRRPLRRAASWLVAVLAIAMIIVAFDPGGVTTALTRLVMPFGNIQWPRQNHLAFRDPPERLAKGQTFEVELIDTRGNLPHAVRIEYRFAKDGGPQTTSELMTRLGDVMVARRDNVDDSFAFRAFGGDDDTMAWRQVEVVEPPKFESLTMIVHPPAYTTHPPTQSGRHLDVLAGSAVEIVGNADKPLKAARILLSDGTSHVAEIPLASDSKQRRHFLLAPEQWIIQKGGEYRLELEDVAGIAAIASEGNIRVRSDSPPAITWRKPSGNLFVTTMAVVPIRLEVEDDIAVKQVELIYERGAAVTATRPTGASDELESQERLVLYRAPEDAEGITRKGNGAELGDSRLVQYDWDLDSLRLPTGSQLTIRAEAMDYRPGVGRTTRPRRISIITSAELESRLAERQEQIVRQLQRALATEQANREDVRRLEIQLREVGTLEESDRNALLATEIAQRRIGSMISDPAGGVVALAESLLAEIEMNRVNSSDMRRMMQELIHAIERLDTGALATASRELTSARKLVGAAVQSGLLAQSLSVAGAAQNEVAGELERIIAELAGSADLQRIVSEIAELHTEQLAHEKNTRDAIGLDAVPLETHELSRSQRADLSKAAAGEEAIERRYSKVEQAMGRAVDQFDDEAIAGRLRDAMSLAAEREIALKMRNVVTNLRENRIGRALQLETEVAANLKQLLDLLKNRTERDSERLIEKLDAVAIRLAKLREETGELREALSGAERPLGDRQQAMQRRAAQLREEMAKLGRELNRLDAPEAAESTTRAAGRLAQQPNDKRSDTEVDQHVRPNQAQQAAQDLTKAAEQLAARRQQLENDLALEFVQRFQRELGHMVDRQREVVANTQSLDADRSKFDQLTASEAREADNLAAEERALAAVAREHSELLVGLASLRLSLEEVSTQLEAAGELLARYETGKPVQNVQQVALKRLTGMVEVFSQTSADAGRNRQGSDGGRGGGGDQQRRPTFELLEVKMLRTLQADLNERTMQHQRAMGGLSDLPLINPRRLELERQAVELAGEQARLADLVEEMLSRDNEEEQ